MRLTNRTRQHRRRDLPYPTFSDLTLRQHLRGEFEMGEFGGVLETRELNMLATADNLPLSVCTCAARSCGWNRLPRMEPSRLPRQPPQGRGHAHPQHGRSLSMAINKIKLDQTQSANNLLWWTLEVRAIQPATARMRR